MNQVFPVALLVITGLGLATLRADDTPSVAVQTIEVRKGSLPELLTAYGSAAPALDGGMTLSFQQEGRVLAVAVTPGETVQSGARLLDFVASPAAITAFQQAVSSVTVAHQQRAHAAQLLTQQLATRDQLAQADKAVADAEAVLDALKREGSDHPNRSLTAPFDGIVSTIPVAQGDRVQPGATLITLTRLDGMVVTVGIDPEQRFRVRPGQDVHLLPFSGNGHLEGKIIRVDGSLNPKNRMLDADVSVPPGSVISGTAYRADIVVGEFTGWIVPRDAVLKDNDGDYLFQTSNNSAARVKVRLVGSNDTTDVVDGPLDPKLPVVVQGNYQLSNKTSVRAGENP